MEKKLPQELEVAADEQLEEVLANPDKLPEIVVEIGIVALKNKFGENFEVE